jgi:CTP:molybdopterin cytidylyltransferase MocA
LREKLLSRRKDAEDQVVFFLGDRPYTAKDLGEELLNMDIRKVFQVMIDRGMVEGVKPGTPWYEHIRVDHMQRTVSSANEGARDNELIASLVKEREAAQAELLETYTPEARERVMEAHRKVRMARKLVSD